MKKYNVFFICITALFCCAGCAGGNMTAGGKYIKRVATFKNDSTDGAGVIRYRPDGKHLAVTGILNPFIYIYDLETGKRIKKLDKQKKKSGTEISYDGDGKYLVYERNDREKRKQYFVVRDVGQDYKVVSDETRSIGGDYLFSAPDGKIINPGFPTLNRGLGIGKPKLRLYTPPDMDVEEFWHNSDGSRRFAISPNGKFMVDVLVELRGDFTIWDDLYHLRIWKYPEMELLKTIKNAHKNSIVSLIWSWDSKILYTDAPIARKVYGSDIKLWNTQNWEVIKHYQSKDWRSSQESFLPDNSHLLGVAKGSRLIQLFNCYSGEVIEEVKFPETKYVITLEQNPAKKNQFAFSSKTEVWIYEVNLPAVK